VFNHFLADTIETGPLLVRVYGFLRDPQGFTNNPVLHFFTSVVFLVQPRSLNFENFSLPGRIEPWLLSGHAPFFSKRQVTYRTNAMKEIRQQVI
jgi:hypothetical protein